MDIRISLADTAEQYQNDGFEILSVSLDSDRQALDRFLAREEHPWKMVYSGKGIEDELTAAHGVSSAHLQGYLNEFVFRFNRRFWPMVGFESVLKIAVQVESPTVQNFYKAARESKAPAKPVPIG